MVCKGDDRERHELSFEIRKLIEKKIKEDFSGKKSFGIISKELNLSRTTVYNEITRRGFNRNSYNAEAAQKHADMKRQNIAASNYIEFSQEEKDTIEKMYIEKKSILDTSKTLGISYSRIREYYKKNGLVSSRSLYAKLNDKIEAKIENLSMQIDILLDAIKDLKK